MEKLFYDLGKILFVNKEKRVLNFAIILAIVISSIHFLTFKQQAPSFEFIHTLLTKLYFLPVLLAALYLGKRGALKLSFIVSILYLPHIIIDTGIISKLYIIENLSEIILIWVVGILAGVLIDKLKAAQAEKVRLATLGKVSSVLNIINHEIMNDYSACAGLAKSLKTVHNNSDGNSFTANLLSEKLEHLGSHLTHLYKLAIPQPSKKSKYNMVHLINKCIIETTGIDSNYQIKLVRENKIPPLNIDVKQMEFAVKEILQTIIKQSSTSKELKVTIKREKEMLKISFSLNGENGFQKVEETEQFDLVADPVKGYSFSIALSIIRAHNGRVKLENGKNGMQSINCYILDDINSIEAE